LIFFYGPQSSNTKEDFLNGFSFVSNKISSLLFEQRWNELFKSAGYDILCFSYNEGASKKAVEIVVCCEWTDIATKSDNLGNEDSWGFTPSYPGLDSCEIMIS